MTPYEIMLSESQERMLLVVKKGREAEVERIFDKWDLHAVRIGEVTTDGRMRVKDHGDGRRRHSEPRADRRGAGLSPADGASRRTSREAQQLDLAALGSPAAPRDVFTRLLASPDDREQALGVPAVRPHGAHQHAGAAGHGRRRRPREGHHARAGAVGRLQRPLRLSRSVSRARSSRWPRRRETSPAPAAQPIGATNCLNFGNPQRPEIMWQFARAVEGMGAACRALDIPITGGNVSLYNETDGKGVLPTPVLGVVGLIEDADTRRAPRVSRRRRRGRCCSARAATSSAAAST